MFVVTFVTILFQVLQFAILGRVLASWVDPQGGNPVTRFLNEVTDPILQPIRSIMPNVGMFDFSPIIAFFLLSLLEQLIVGALR